MTDHAHGGQRRFPYPERTRNLQRGFAPNPSITELDFSTLENCRTASDELRERRNEVSLLRWRADWLHIYRLKWLTVLSEMVEIK